MGGSRRAPLFAENFARNLDKVRAFLQPRGARAFDRLLDRLFGDVVPLLCRHPRAGRDFFAHKAGSEEGVASIRRLRSALAGAELREFVADDYIVLYAIDGRSVAFLAIKHHRQLSFDLRLFWA